MVMMNNNNHSNNHMKDDSNKLKRLSIESILVMMNNNNHMKDDPMKDDSKKLKRLSIESILSFTDDGQKGSIFGGDELVDVFDKPEMPGMSLNIDDDQKEVSVLQGTRGSIFDGEQMEVIFKQQPNDDVIMSTSLSPSDVFCSDNNAELMHQEVSAAKKVGGGVQHRQSLSVSDPFCSYEGIKHIHEEDSSTAMKVSGAQHKQSMSAPNVLCSDAVKFGGAQHKQSMSAPNIFCSTSPFIKDSNDIISKLKQKRQQLLQLQQQQQQQQQQNLMTTTSSSAAAAAAMEVSSKKSPPVGNRDTNTHNVDKDKNEDKDKGVLVIEKPMPYDIICGRNSGSHNWCGNKRFRVTIMMNLQSYVDAPTREDKTYVIKSVMDILEHDVGARFLKKVGESTYQPLEEKQIREKVGHAFRDMIYTKEKSIL